MLEATVNVGACLSLSGRYGRFGTQAARALRAWADLDGAVELVVVDDRSDRTTLEAELPELVARSNVLLGPYSTQLTRAAARIAADKGRLMWNHGGAGDDVQTAHPGIVVSVPTPASRYAEPFLDRLEPAARLVIVAGNGSFARQVADGAEAIARDRGMDVRRTGPGTAACLEVSQPSEAAHLLVVGTFEADVEAVRRARSESPAGGGGPAPGSICSIAAGVRDFASMVDDPTGVFGLAQWFEAERPTQPILGPGEAEFLRAYARTRPDRPERPDYVAVQAVAAAVLGTHCLRTGADPATLHTTTLFGAFGIDPETGLQTAHTMVLVRWTEDGHLVRA